MTLHDVRYGVMQSDLYSFDSPVSDEVILNRMTNTNPLRVVRCRQCGYNLQGMSVGGRCPECGESVDGSITAAALLCAGEITPIEYSNRRWIRAVRRGAAALVLAAVLFNLIGLLLMVQHHSQQVPVAVPIMIALGSFVSLAAGAGLLSAREPWTGAAAPMRPARFLVRFGFVLCGLVLLSPTWLSNQRMSGWMRVYPVAVDLSALLVTVPALGLAASLAVRSGRPRLALLCRSCIVAVILAAIAECLIPAVPIGTNMAQMSVTLPLIGDGSALALLVDTERYWRRFDAITLVIAFNALVSLGITATWAGLWIGLSKSAQDPPTSGDG